MFLINYQNSTKGQAQLDGADLDESWMLFVDINQLQLGLVAHVTVSVSCHCQHVRYTLHNTIQHWKYKHFTLHQYYCVSRLCSTSLVYWSYSKLSRFPKVEPRGTARLSQISADVLSQQFLSHTNYNGHQDLTSSHQDLTNRSLNCYWLLLCNQKSCVLYLWLGVSWVA